MQPLIHEQLEYHEFSGLAPNNLGKEEELMKRTSLSALTLLLLSSPSFLIACSDEGDDAGSGGMTSSGGDAASGGEPGAGGSTDTGGADPGTGGESSGGASGTGGDSGEEDNRIPGTDDYNCSGGAGGAGELQFVEYAKDFTVPVLATHAPDDDRVFVVELGGVIKIVKDGVTNPTAFLDIRDRVYSRPDPNAGGEQGLLGLAFHPDYAENGLFYVHYSAASAATDFDNGDTVIAEYKVSDNGDIADVGSERVVLDEDQPGTNHNGGTIAFGADGYLYIALGDGGGQNDQHGNGQAEATRLGSILRINPLQEGSNGYTIPDGNLKDILPSAAAELWDMGFRNPYRMNFDACTGHLYIGDVGQETSEEINVELVGDGQRNYGWNTMEGFDCFSPSSGCDETGLSLPVLAYPRGPGGAVIGGAVYRGSELPWLRGTYFYADNIQNRIWSFVYDEKTGEIANEVNHTAELSPTAITAIQNDSKGELLFVQGDGKILKLTTP